MAAKSLHSKILIEEARQTLAPLGLTQIGRSRSWYDDHGWWIITVGFEPSSWSRGSYLNVGAQWLWVRFPGFCYEYEGRQRWRERRLFGRRQSFITFETEEQFRPQARRLAEWAAKRVKELRGELDDIETLPRRLIAGNTHPADRTALHAGIVLALRGRTAKARSLVAPTLIAPPEYDWHEEWNQQVNDVLELLEDRTALRNHLTTVITQQRAVLRLPTRDIELPG